MGGSPFSAGGCGGSSGPPQPIPRWRMGMCRPPPNKKMPSLWGGSSLTAGITPEPPGGAQLSPPPPNPQVWVGDGHCPPPPPRSSMWGSPFCAGCSGEGGEQRPPHHPPGIAWRWAVPPISAMWGSPFCARGSGGGESRTPPPIPPGIGWRWALTPRSPMRGSTFCAGGSGGGAQDPPTPPGVGWGWAVPPRSYEGVPVLCGRLWGGLQDPSPPFRYRLEMGSAPPDL